MSGPTPLPGWLGRLLGVESAPQQVLRPPAPPAGPVRAVGQEREARAAAVRRPIEDQRSAEPVPAAPRPARPPDAAAGVRRLLDAPRDARIAVAAAEVLAPPRALRPYRGPDGA